jgi:hypothetical protein
VIFGWKVQGTVYIGRDCPGVLPFLSIPHPRLYSIYFTLQLSALACIKPQLCTYLCIKVSYFSYLPPFMQVLAPVMPAVSYFV